MRRFHLFEWEDQRWLPTVFRDFITDHLHYAMRRARLFDVVAPVLKRALQATGENRILDLCSGGGGPYPSLAQKLVADHGMPVQVTLTDLFPNSDAISRAKEESGGLMTYRTESTDAFNVPPELGGVRTIFAALHHFRPESAKRLLADAVTKRRAIGAFEPLERDLKSMHRMCMLAFLSSIIVTHRVGPMTFARALFTYVIPLAPLIFAWDGVVSCLRSYTPDDLRKMTADLGVGSYSWEVGQVDAQTRFGGDYKITYVMGIPKPIQDAPIVESKGVAHG